MGKFARLALGTANIDYNGRLCMVSAGGGNKKALGIDRASNSWATSRSPRWSSSPAPTSPSARRSPPTTSGGPRQRREADRAGPAGHPDRPHRRLFLGLKPGTDSALIGAVLHQLIERDWLDHDFIEQHTVGLRGGRRGGRRPDPAVAQEVTGVPAGRIEQAAELWGTPRPACCCTPAASSTTARASRTSWPASTSGSPPASTASPAAASRPSPARQRPGRPRARPEVRPAAGQPRHHQPRAPRLRRRAWGLRRPRSPGRAVLPGDHRGDPPTARSRACCSICFNPMVSLPDTEHPVRGAREARVLRRHRLLPVRDRAPRRRRAARLAARGGRGHLTTAEGGHQDQPGRRPPGEARKRLGDPPRPRPPPRRGTSYFPLRDDRGHLRGAPPVSAGAAPTTTASPGSGSRPSTGVFWPCPEGHPGTPRLYEGGRFYTPTARRGSSRSATATRPRSGRRRVPALADHRPGRQPVPVGHPDPPHRPARSTSTPSRWSRCTRARRTARHRRRRPRPGHLAARRDDRAGAGRETIRPDTVFIPYHWAGGKQAANQLTNRVLDPVSKIPEYKVCAVRIERLGPATRRRRHPRHGALHLRQRDVADRRPAGRPDPRRPPRPP
jgi:assimilatory nitrate reductase catalytic subunit